MAKQRVDSADSFTDAYMLRVVTDWFKAVSEFHEWYHKLDSAINDYYSTDYQLNHNIFNPDKYWSLQELINLRLEVAAGLVTLEREVDSVDQVLTLLTIYQLSMHTKTIELWNGKIQDALGLGSVGTA